MLETTADNSVLGTDLIRREQMGRHQRWTGMGFGDSLRAMEGRERYCCKVIYGALMTFEAKGLR